MKTILITVTFKDGQTNCDPAVVHVDPGDTVQWTCAQGHLAVDFGDDTPFTKTQLWQADAGHRTEPAVVKSTAKRGVELRPTISVAGTEVARSRGDLIVRAGP